MRNRTLMLASDSPVDHSFVSAVATCLGTSVVGPLSVGEVLARASATPDALVFINVSTDERLAEFGREFEQLSKKTAQTAPIKAGQIHLIGSSDLKEFEAFCANPVFGHFILPGKEDPTEAGLRYGRTLEAIMASDLVPSKDRPSFESRLKRSSDRARVVETLDAYLIDALELSNRVRSVMLKAVDELLMNAIFDAPRGQDGNQLFKNRPRTDDFELADNAQVEFSLHNDGQYLTFTSTDFFGTLDQGALFRKLFRSFKDREYLIDARVENAGIGLATTFGSGASLVFRSQNSVKTEVSVIFRKTNSYREVMSQFRYLSVHLSR